jgi:hypothetical protein
VESRARLGAAVLPLLALGCGGLVASEGDVGSRDAGQRADVHVAPTDGPAETSSTDALDGPAEGAEGGPDAGCSDLRARWTKAIAEPIVPGSFVPHAGAAGLSGAHLMGDLTLALAEDALCKGVDLPDLRPDASPELGAMGWGLNVFKRCACPPEIQLDYLPDGGGASLLRLELGYQGTLRFYSNPAQFGPASHSYAMEIGFQITKDGAPWEIDWFDPNAGTLTEIYNGILYTFGGPIAEGGIEMGWTKDCRADGSCIIVGPSEAPLHGNEAILAVLPLGLYLRFLAEHSLQPEVSTLAGVDMAIAWPTASIPP